MRLDWGTFIDYELVQMYVGNHHAPGNGCFKVRSENETKLAPNE